MTDLGKGALGVWVSAQKRGGPAATLPKPAGTFCKAGSFFCLSGGSSLLFCFLFLSDEQEDESMETTGKVEPV